MTGSRRAVNSAGRVSRLPGRRVTPDAVSRRARHGLTGNKLEGGKVDAAPFAL